MSSHYNFKDNLTIDNNRYLKWYNSSNTRQDIIGLDASNNITINDGGGNISINPSGTSHTFINNGNTGMTIIDSSIGIGYSTTTNTNSKLTLAKNNFISVNTGSGSNDGYIAITGSSSLDTSSGSRFISYGQNHSTLPGHTALYTGNSGEISFYTAFESKRAQILNNGTTNFIPNGSTIRLSIQDTISTFNNQVSITDSTQCVNATTGALIIAGGLGVLGNTTIDGTLSINSMVGNLEFNSTRPSTSYSSGSITVEGGIGIQSTTDVASVTSGGGLSIAGGLALGKSMIVGGNISILSTTLATDSQSGSLVVYGGVGLNKTVSHKATAPHVNYAPLSTGNESSIHFYTLNDFTETSGTSGGWHMGQNALSIGTGNFTIGHLTNPRLSFHSDGRTVISSNSGSPNSFVAALGLALSINNSTLYTADTDIGYSNRQLTVFNGSSTNNTFAAVSLQSSASGTCDVKLVGNSVSTSRKLVTTIDNVDLLTLQYTGTILGSNTSTVSLSTDSISNILDIRGGTSSDSSGQILLYGSSASSTGSVLIIGGNTSNGNINLLTNESGTLYSRISINRGGDISFSNTSGSLLDISGNSSTFQNNTIIDTTSTTALVVRKNGNTGDVLNVDTTNSRINFIDTSFYTTISSTIPYIVFDTNDNLLYDRTSNQFRFTIAGTSVFEIVGSGVTIVPTTQINDSSNTIAISGGGINVNGDIITPRIYTHSASVGSPTFTNRSIGSRIILSSNIGASTVDYSFGIESGSLWSSVPTTSSTFKWYGGTTQIMSLTGSVLTLDSTQIIKSTVDSASNTTGALQVSGGIGVEKTLWTRNLNVGSSSSVMGTCTFRTNIDCGLNISGSSTNITLQSHDQGNSGGLARDLTISGRDISFITNDGSFLSVLVNSTNTTFYKTVDSTSTTTGSIVVNGGIGLAKSMTIGGNVNIMNTVESTSITTGSLQVLGGVGISKSVYIGGLAVIDKTSTSAFTVRKDSGGSNILNVNTTDGIVSVLSTVNSTSTTTGSLQIIGGLGIQGSLYIGGALVSNSDFQLSSINLSSTSPSTNLTTGSIITLGGLSIRNTSNALSITNGGSILSAGGMSIAKDVYIGGNLDVSSTINNLGAIQILNNDSNISYLQIGSSRTSGSIQPLFITGWDKTPIVAEFWCTTPSISKSTGSFVIHSGGLAINHTSNSSSITAGGSLTVGGGASINKAMFIGTTLQVGDNTVSPQHSLVVSTEAYGANKSHGIRLSVNDASSTTHINYRYFDLKLLSNGASTYRGALSGSLGGGTTTDFEFISLHQTGSIDFNGISNFLSTTNSSSITSGSIISTGGLGIAKDVYIGGNVNIKNTVDSISSTSGSVIVSGGVGIAKSLYIGSSSVPGSEYIFTGTNNQLQITDGGTGISLTGHDGGTLGGVYRGIGIIGNSIRMGIGSGSAQDAMLIDRNGGNGEKTIIYMYSTIDSTASSVGALITSGGVGIAKSMSVGGNVNIQSTVNSTSITTGSLQVLGGVGISKSVYIGGSVVIDETSTSAFTVRKDSGGSNVLNVNTSTDYIQSNAQLNIVFTNAESLIVQNTSGSKVLVADTTNFNVKIDATEDSISTTSGALRVGGGVGILKSLNIGGTTAITITTNATSNTAGGSLTISGGLAIAKDTYVGGTFYNSSDKRLKTNITPIESNVLALLNTLVPMTYTHNKDLLPNSSDDILYGLIAQDVLKVFPHLVKQNSPIDSISDSNSESFYNLDYTRLCVVLLKAIQELSQKISILESSVASTFCREG